MSTHEVLVVRTGTANLASVLAALDRLGARPVFSTQPDQIRSAERLVLPGVGTLSAAMERLQSEGLVEALRERLRSDRPSLAICLGLQLLFEGSQESPDTRALGLFPGRAERFGSSVRVPQLGWNVVEPDPDCAFLVSGYAYFANSFRILQSPTGLRSAVSDHDGPFLAAFERGGLLACQFHPELSGAWGHALLQRWWKGVV